MLVKRIIPCLDVHGGRVVKGINFVDLKDAGDPVEMAAFYDREGADELVFLDISATSQQRRTMLGVVKDIAQKVFVPFTVGGGITNVDDIKSLLSAGADKVSINSVAVREPGLIATAVHSFGSHRIVAAIDARHRIDAEGWEVYVNGGKTPTALDVMAWARQLESLGAGEILLTSMDKDGTRDGYDLELTAAVSDEIGIPVIASGGAGNLEHLYEALQQGHADAVLCASIFHYGDYSIAQAKQYLRSKGVAVRSEND